jgi:hypothetical protein
MEYRYWAFIEAHPAHNALPVNAKIEAMDVLTWAWTGELASCDCEDNDAHSRPDRLLPSQRTVPAPFTQEECQELMSLLRSFSTGKMICSLYHFWCFILFQSKTMQDFKPSSKHASSPGFS